jgi:NAD(P)-dependent dehydrogenase (short-subunit alcohol dehydrogenase family)
LAWCALRLHADHFSYFIRKAALSALTKSLATNLAPNITGNGLALGAILPPADKPPNSDILKSSPASHWVN